MVQNRMVKKGFIGAIVLAVILFGGVILGLIMCRVVGEDNLRRIQQSNTKLKLKFNIKSALFVLGQ